MKNTVLVIPSRFASTRLSGKPLRLIAGKPMIQHVYERAKQSNFETIIIATDDARIEACCLELGATVCMTSKEHETGSDRLAEVVTQYNWSDDTIVVNLQGDEPLTPIENLYQVADNLANNPEAAIATLATPLQNSKEYNDPNVVKVVMDKKGMALYFSRASIPFQRDVEHKNCTAFALRHIGIYAYRASYLKAFAKMDVCPLEDLEKLEQLRAMWYGSRIHVEIAKEVPGHGVDTEEDLIAVEKVILAQK
ncbi:MAG: 3-deoxy-manno-octulosonate cytidylyltransferase [Aquificaceae bacterium]|nr:MAG: 3-deoxy-manno-octulosonate cytidylyltransferase [Aquificaceae bacterium]